MTWCWWWYFLSLIAGIWSILTWTWSKVKVKHVVWCIGFWVTSTIWELLFKLRQKCLILLIQNLSFLPKPFILFHYVTVLVVQLCVQSFHCYENHNLKNICGIRTNEKGKNICKYSSHRVKHEEGVWVSMIEKKQKEMSSLIKLV